MGVHEKKKREFSKIISVVGIVFWILVNLYGMVIIAITLDTSPLVYIIGSADAVVAVVYSTYSLKARAENMIKLKSVYKDSATLDCIDDPELMVQNDDHETDLKL